MRDRVDRKFTLLDAMILVAATAVGMGLIRNFTPDIFAYQFDPMTDRQGELWTSTDWAHWVAVMLPKRFYWLMPLLATLTVTVMALRLRPPRPRRVRLMRQPGFVAGMAAVSGIALWVPIYAMGAIQLPPTNSPPHHFLAIVTGAAVGSSWVILFDSGRWKANPGWIDRLGRILGAAWLAPIPIFIISSVLSRL